MSNFTLLRLSPSGPSIEGENQRDTLLWDTTERKWFTGPGGDGEWTEAAFSVGSLSSSMADVTLSSLGDFVVAPGDTFSYAPVQGSFLAGVALVNMWSPAPGQLRARFFGTTEGGACVVAIHRHPGQPLV